MVPTTNPKASSSHRKSAIPPHRRLDQDSQQFLLKHSVTMVRMSGTSYDPQGFHRESDEDATKIMLGPGIEVSAEGVSPQTLLEIHAKSERWEEHSDDAKEKGPDMDLEEKPRPPPHALSESPRTVITWMKLGRRKPKEPHPQAPRRPRATLKKPKSARKQLKAPDADTEDRGEQQWTNEDLAQTIYKKDLFSFLLDKPVMKILSPTLI
ncbi:LOW QUALITY PROTEIN: hypothetical protein PHMEG_00012019 [Phytophthora megakarya]|uniref:Uncharacterized protein n=1 Tax=Phytophthora megakarya TaxID=4795 RepID=A0A225WCD5_9STRA|nr:LOW QUALITY PROTEIN: hypothetical protein PHMEG_00012019 [Phytophthora megakarya]